MKKLLLVALTSTVGIIGMTSMSHGYDKPFNVECSVLFELGQKSLSGEDKLTTMANAEIGVRAKNLYSLADEAREDFKVISDAFVKCQANKEFYFNVNELNTPDVVEIEKEKR